MGASRLRVKIALCDFGFWKRYAYTTRDAIGNNRCSSLKGTRRAVHVLRNIEARSYNHFCREKTISITYSESVFVTLGIHHAIRMRHTAICGL